MNTASRKSSVLFTTSRLIVRNLKEDDLISFHHYRSDPEVTRYQGFDPYSEAEALAFIREHSHKKLGVPGEWVQYGIENIASSELVGDCAFHLQSADPRIAELGITLSPFHQKKGYAREVLQGMMDFLFGTQNIHRIVETVDAENAASIHLLKSLHFREEGFFKENIFFKGSWGSELQFAMLRSEWLERRQGQQEA